MKKLFGIIVLALIMLTVTEVTAQDRKEYYSIIAPDKETREFANEMVKRLELDTTYYVPSSRNDTLISVLLIFDVDNFRLDKSNVIRIVSVEIQVIPEKPVYIPVGDVYIGMINNDELLIEFTKGLSEKIQLLIENYIKHLKDKVHK